MRIKITLETTDPKVVIGYVEVVGVECRYQFLIKTDSLEMTRIPELNIQQRIDLEKYLYLLSARYLSSHYIEL